MYFTVAEADRMEPVLKEYSCKKSTMDPYVSKVSDIKTQPEDMLSMKFPIINLVLRELVWNVSKLLASYIDISILILYSLTAKMR